jgi:hypothetical protein
VIPTMIVFGLVLGRWWVLALALAAVVWPGLLVATGVMGFEPALLGGAVFGVANAAVGVLVHQALLWAVRRPRRRLTAPEGAE